MASLVDITIALLVRGFAEFVGALVSSRASRRWQILKIVLDLDCRERLPACFSGRGHFSPQRRAVAHRSGALFKQSTVTPRMHGIHQWKDKHLYERYAPISGASGLAPGPKYLRTTRSSTSLVFSNTTPARAAGSVQKTSSSVISANRISFGQSKFRLFIRPLP